MAAMGEMIGNISHQFRQPLNAISTSASGTRISIMTNNISFEEVDKTMDNIVKYTQHLSDTISSFREFFKNDKEETYFDLKEIVISGYYLKLLFFL